MEVTVSPFCFLADQREDNTAASRFFYLKRSGRSGGARTGMTRRLPATGAVWMPMAGGGHRSCEGLFMHGWDSP